MAMTFRQIEGYLAQRPAVVAVEQLEGFDVHALVHMMAPQDRRSFLLKLQQQAEGRPALTPAEEQAAKKALYDAEWARLRARLGRGPARRGLRPGERVVIPADG